MIYHPFYCIYIYPNAINMKHLLRLLALFVSIGFFSCNQQVETEVQQINTDSIRQVDSINQIIEHQRIIDSVNTVTREQQIISDSIANQVLR